MDTQFKFKTYFQDNNLLDSKSRGSLTEFYIIHTLSYVTYTLSEWKHNFFMGKEEEG